MSERSLFNVACKLIGLWLLFHSCAEFIWAFLASRYNTNYSVFDPSEELGWSSGAVAMVFGLLLVCRSGTLIKLVFRIDEPLDANPTEQP